MIFQLTVLFCILSAVVTIITFIAYARARMDYREKEEQRYQSLHFITLFLFVVFGVLILVQLSQRIP